MWYRLEGKTPVPCERLEGMHWFEANFAGRTVARTRIGPAEVSTVFLAIDHGFGFKGRPILFETMIFVDDDSDPRGLDFGGEYQKRYATWEEAEAGHAEAVALVEAALAVPTKASAPESAK